MKKGIHIVNLKKKRKSINCFLKIGKLKKQKLSPRWNSNTQTLDLRLLNTCAIGCAKKTAENIFKRKYSFPNNDG